MILEKAPPVLLFSLERSLSIEDTKRMAELEAKSELTSDDKKEKEALYKKQFVNREIFSWIPIPLETAIVPVIPQSYKTTSIKKIDMYKNVAYLRQSMNTETITFISSSNIFINALIFALDFMFQNANAFPSIKYFSNDMIVLNGRLVNFSHSKNTNGDEQAISIEIQKGLAENIIKVKQIKPAVPVVPTFAKVSG